MSSSIRHRAWTFVPAALALAAASCSRTEPGAPRHVILISLDTVRADHLGCYGAPEGSTPALDALAAECALFQDVTTAAPTTLAAHTSIMTGRSPRSHGVPRNGFVVNAENVMLAEILREHGFRTAAFLGSFALDARFDFDQGFEFYDDRFDLERGDGQYDQNQRRAERVTDAVLAYVDEARPERSFLFVHYFDAHEPFDPPPPYDRDPQRPGARRAAELLDLELATAAQQKAATGVALGVAAVRFKGLTSAILDGATRAPIGSDTDFAALYAAEIRYLDFHVGRLLEGLRERGILDRALLIVTADHGETFWEHGDAWNHGLCTYQTTVGVPLLVSWPGRIAPRCVAAAVSSIDVAPTILGLCGIAPPAAVEGQNLAPALAGERFERGPLFSEATQPTGRVEQGVAWRNDAKAKCVRIGSFKYVWTPYLEREELYDLAADPSEQNDLLKGASPEHRRRADEMRAALERWRTAHTPLPSSTRRQSESDTAERLEQLGYADELPESEDR